jgi:hypothetical protein
MSNEAYLKNIVKGFKLNLKSINIHNINVYNKKNAENFICPGDFGLDEIYIDRCNKDACVKCWEKAIEKLEKKVGF